MAKKVILIILITAEVLLCGLLALKLVRGEPKAERITSCIELPERYMNGFEKELYRKAVDFLRKVSMGEEPPAGGVWFEFSEMPDSTDEAYASAKKVEFFLERYVPEYTYWLDYLWITPYLESEYGVYGVSMYCYPSPVFVDYSDYDFINYSDYDSGLNFGYIQKEDVEYAQKAFENAKAIAAKYDGKSDYEKICGYAEEICKAVKYDHHAADTDNFSEEDIRPWRIVSVFDGDPNTNVVCEAYGLAFEYLCGLGGIECHYVTGYMGDEGAHGWNTVVLDGKNYFTDVTACDTVNYTDAEIKRMHPFILTSASDVAPDGFTTGHIGKGSYYSDRYVYGDDTIEFLPEELRLVSETKYHTDNWLYIAIGVLAVSIAVRAVIPKKKPKETSDFCGNY